MLILNKKDIDRIVQTDEVVSAIERAYQIQDDVATNTPERMHLSAGNNTLLVMPGMITGMIGTKLIAVNPTNPRKGKPAISGVMVLQDSITGEPIAMLNGSKLTAVRTGAVGATAAKYLAPSSSGCLGIIGTGVQAYYLALMTLDQRPFKKMILYNRNPAKAMELKHRLSKKCKMLAIEVAGDPEKVVHDSDLVITATSSTSPVFEYDETMQGKTFIAIGSYQPDMQEIPSALMVKADGVYVDTMHAAAESGDLRMPINYGILKPEELIPFGRVISDPDRRQASSTIIFKSVGSSIFDLTVADYLYKKAKRIGVGKDIDV